ncbi:hypothetical protein H4582DRAFT_168543 [Lactarius indigo]|nr:hypothetical protein H4582DRAFT_168543 [Lactarius indigo]
MPSHDLGKQVSSLVHQLACNPVPVEPAETSHRSPIAENDKDEPTASKTEQSRQERPITQSSNMRNQQRDPVATKETPTDRKIAEQGPEDCTRDDQTMWELVQADLEEIIPGLQTNFVSKQSDLLTNWSDTSETDDRDVIDRTPTTAPHATLTVFLGTSRGRHTNRSTGNPPMNQRMDNRSKD